MLARRPGRRRLVHTQGAPDGTPRAFPQGAAAAQGASPSSASSGSALGAEGGCAWPPGLSSSCCTCTVSCWPLARGSTPCSCTRQTPSSSTTQSPVCGGQQGGQWAKAAAAGGLQVWATVRRSGGPRAGRSPPAAAELSCRPRPGRRAPARAGTAAAHALPCQRATGCPARLACCRCPAGRGGGEVGGRGSGRGRQALLWPWPALRACAHACAAVA
jgi:hypothetical protein